MFVKNVRIQMIIVDSEHDIDIGGSIEGPMPLDSLADVVEDFSSRAAAAALIQKKKAVETGETQSMKVPLRVQAKPRQARGNN